MHCDINDYQHPTPQLQQPYSNYGYTMPSRLWTNLSQNRGGREQSSQPTALNKRKYEWEKEHQ